VSIISAVLSVTRLLSEKSSVIRVVASLEVSNFDFVSVVIKYIIMDTKRNMFTRENRKVKVKYV